MHIPAYFYYETPFNDGLDYGTTPTSAPNVPRLLANAPCWPTLCVQMDKKPKTLIVNMEKKWSVHDISILIHRLTDLQTKTFKVLLWDNGCIRRLPLLHKESQDYLFAGAGATEPTNDQQVIDVAMRRFDLTHDELLILNDDKLQALILGGDGDWPETNDFKKIEFTNSPITIESFDALLLNKTDDIEELVLTDCLNLTNGTLSPTPALPHLKTIKIQSTNKNHVIGASFLSTLIKRAPNLTHFSLSVGPMSQHLLAIMFQVLPISTLEYLHIDAIDLSYDFGLIGTSLVNAAKLKTLKITSNIKQRGFDQDLNLTSLEEVELVRVKISSDVLAKFLNQCTQLKILKLIHCTIEGEVSQEVNLPFLEELSLISTPKFFDIQMTPLVALKYLTIYKNEFDHFGGYGRFEDKDLERISLNVLNSLSSLTELNLQGVCMVPGHLSDAKHLKKVSLNFRAISDEDAQSILRDLSLDQVEELAIFNTVLSEDFLERCLNRALKVKKVEFSACRFEGNTTQSFQFKALQEAKFGNCQASAKVIGALLCNSSLLETLNINLSNLQGDIIHALNLKSLKKISIDGTKLTATTFANILQGAQNLKESSFNSCQISGEIKQSVEFELNSLEELTFEGVGHSLQAEILGCLLNNTPRLKKLTLNHISIVGDIADELNLSTVEEIKMKDIDLTAATLQHILRHATQLKTLDLSQPTIQGELTASAPLDALKELYLIGIPLSLFFSLLTQRQHLTVLYLSAEDHIVVNEDFIRSTNGTTLQRLFLENLIIEGALLGELLSKHPNLNDLSLEGCIIEGNIDEHLVLNSLRSLNIPNTTLTASSLAKIITHAPDLLFLAIEDSVIIEDPKKHLNLPMLYKGVRSQLLSYQLQQAYSSELSSSESDVEELDPVITNEEYVDADTSFGQSDLGTEFITHQLFYAMNNQPAPPTTNYRLMVFNTLNIRQNKCSVKEAFMLKNTPDIEPTPVYPERSITDLYSDLCSLSEPDHDQYYGRKKLRLSTNWQALPSLSANEKMTRYHLDKTHIDVDLGYSEQDNRYYIRSYEEPNEDDVVTIDFLIRIPKKMPVLSEDIEALAGEYRAFQARSLNIEDSEKMSGAMYMQALQEQKVGACRHRSVAFKARMESNYPSIPVRIIANECHMLTELRINNQWVMCDLGGYPAIVKIKKPSPPPVPANHPFLRPLAESAVTLDTEGHAELPRTYAYFAQQILPQPEQVATSLADYFLRVLQQPVKSVLLQCKTTPSFEANGYQLQAFCKTMDRPSFYIDSPEDLICSAAWIERSESGHGTIKQGPGGALYQFLKQHEADGSHPVLIVNYNQFTASDIVRFNALLDPIPQADGTGLPGNTTVIGLINPDKPGAYTGLDFYSRFGSRLDLPEQLALFAVAPDFSSSRRQRIIFDGASDVEREIDLYLNSHWEERLLGHWVLKGQQLTFVEGELIQAINEGKTHIHIKNGPWHNRQFLRFWQAATLTGLFQCAGKAYALPESFVLTQSSGIVFETADVSITMIETFKPTDSVFVLNTSTFSKFFNRYCCNTMENAIYQEAGYLEANKEKTIVIYLSHTIPPEAWSELLAHCKKHHVDLQVIRAPGAYLPLSMGVQAPLQTLGNPTPWLARSRAVSIESSDIDVTLAYIKADVVIDVTELEPANLLTKIDGQLNLETFNFEFHEQSGALSKALNEDKLIVLKGVFSPEMQHYLSEELVKQCHNPTRGRLILISNKPILVFARNDSIAFSRIIRPDGQMADLFSNPTVFKHTPTMAEKHKQLEDEFGEECISFLTDSLIESKPLASLKAIIRHHQRYTNSSDLNQTWVGMEQLPRQLRVDSTINFAEANVISSAFNQQRLALVKHGLSNAPYVFIAGMTGVGKTTFIECVWRRIYPSVHFGESALRNWASDKTPGLKTLFIDEATLCSSQWSAFEGLFNDPLAIMIDNEYVLLTEEHKVIFAGNPVSYGSGRHLSELFSRHGGSIVFEPMPPEYIYTQILMPILVSSGIGQADQEAAAEKIINVAAYLTSISSNEILISVRELAMMALLAVNYQRHHADSIIVDAAAFYAYSLGRGFVPEAQKACFDRCFYFTPLVPLPEKVFSNEFFITASNQPAFNALNDYLRLRETRRSQGGNLLQLDGGLGGLILEGEPGIGKSELVIAALTARGYLVEHDFEHPSRKQNFFYIIPPSMSHDAKKALLLKAFSEGAVVVMNEINSSPMMERFLNDLLMGKMPAGVVINDKHPGFMIIATQNPTTMAGRARTSLALQHRMQTIKLPAYNKQEMIDILTQKGLVEFSAEEMVNEYIIIIEEAKRNNRPSPLCFRNLIKRADEEKDAFDSALALDDNLFLNMDTLEIDWAGLINEPFNHQGIINQAHAFVVLYEQAPIEYSLLIKQKLHDLASRESGRQPEAWLALALIADSEHNEAEKEHFINALSDTPHKRARMTFFDGQDDSEYSIHQALLKCRNLQTDVRGINAFLDAYADKFYQILGLLSLGAFDN